MADEKRYAVSYMDFFKDNRGQEIVMAESWKTALDDVYPGVAENLPDDIDEARSEALNQGFDFYVTEIYEFLKKEIAMNKIEIRGIGDSNLIPIREMEPLQIARIVGGGNDGIIVMRTSSVHDFEVMDLTSPGHGKCWTGNAAGGSMSVELLPDAKIIVQL